MSVSQQLSCNKVALWRRRILAVIAIAAVATAITITYWRHYNPSPGTIAVAKTTRDVGRLADMVMQEIYDGYPSDIEDHYITWLTNGRRRSGFWILREYKDRQTGEWRVPSRWGGDQSELPVVFAVASFGHGDELGMGPVGFADGSVSRAWLPSILAVKMSGGDVGEISIPEDDSRFKFGRAVSMLRIFHLRPNYDSN